MGWDGAFVQGIFLLLALLNEKKTNPYPSGRGGCPSRGEQGGTIFKSVLSLVSWLLPLETDWVAVMHWRLSILSAYRLPPGAHIPGGALTRPFRFACLEIHLDEAASAYAHSVVNVLSGLAKR